MTGTVDFFLELNRAFINPNVLCDKKCIIFHYQSMYNFSLANQMFSMMQAYPCFDQVHYEVRHKQTTEMTLIYNSPLAVLQSPWSPTHTLSSPWVNWKVHYGPQRAFSCVNTSFSFIYTSNFYSKNEKFFWTAAEKVKYHVWF